MIISKQSIGIIFGILAYFSFSILDATQKTLILYHSVFQLMLVKYFFVLFLSLVESKRKNNIRVNTVAPTFVATPMVKKFFKNKEFKKLALGNIPMGKLATESDVATSVCFLASSASSMVTATSILVDGGWTAK